MSRMNNDLYQTVKSLGSLSFYYGVYEKDEKRIGAWISSDQHVYVGVVVGLWFFRLSAWIQR